MLGLPSNLTGTPLRSAPSTPNRLDARVLLLDPLDLLLTLGHTTLEALQTKGLQDQVLESKVEAKEPRTAPLLDRMEQHGTTIEGTTIEVSR